MVRNIPNTPQSSSKHAGDFDFESKIGQVGGRLCECVHHLLSVLPNDAMRPRGLSQSLGVNKDLASKLLIAANKRDPLAAVYFMPGPEALRKVLGGASNQSIDPSILSNLDLAIRDFESLVRQEVGGRSALDAMISAWLPEARTRFEMANRQAAHKAMANIKGLTADVSLRTILVHPSETGKPHDFVTLFGCLGLRRVRPGVPIYISTGIGGPGADCQQPLTLDGNLMEQFAADSLLSAFCSQPLPPIHAETHDVFIKYVIASDRIGIESGADLFFAEYISKFLDQYNPTPGLRASHSADIEIPTKELIFDVFLHHDVWQGIEPELLTYDTSLYGEVNVNDRFRDIDRLDLIESVQNIGPGLSSCRVSSIPNYVNMLQQVCDRRGWDPAAFRGFRCHTNYPVYGSQIIMAFDRRSPQSDSTEESA